MKHVKRYFVTGGSGRLGTVITPKIVCAAPSRAEVDILNPESLERALAAEPFAAVLHLAAVTSPRQAAADKDVSYQCNVIGTRNVATAAARQDIKVFYISTDYVFPGTTGNYRETDNPDPANWYGFTKYAGECEVRYAAPRHCIIRTSFRPVAWGFPTAYTNVMTSADYIDVIAGELLIGLEADPDGLLHLGTPVKSFFELARRRHPDIRPEECRDDAFPKHRNLNIDRWLAIRQTYGQATGKAGYPS